MLRRCHWALKFPSAVRSTGAATKLVELFRRQLDVLFTRRFLFPIFPQPSFPTLAGGGIPACKSQARDVGIGNRDFRRFALGKEPDQRLRQRAGGAAVENVAFDLGAVFAG